MLTPTALAADALAFYLPHHLDEDIERKLLKKSTYYNQFVQIQALLSILYDYYLSSRS